MAGDWPDLPLDDWADTCATLHLWTQVVGKIRLAHAPMINHWWQVPLYVSARGLATSPIPIAAEILELEFDFIGHRLVARTSRGDERAYRALIRRFHGSLIGTAASIIGGGPQQ